MGDALDGVVMEPNKTVKRLVEELKALNEHLDRALPLPEEPPTPFYPFHARR